ncbi:MAG: DUF4358 domain-containing protein [Erysipelotrichaceae bacterium]
MKRIAILFAACVLFLSGCGSKNNTVKEVDIQALGLEVQEGFDNQTFAAPAMMLLDEAQVQSLYGLNAETHLEAFEVFVPVPRVNATEVALFQVKEGQLETVLTQVEARLEAMDQQWAQYLPDQHALVKQAVVVEKGNYVFVVVAKDVEAIEALLLAAFE